MFFSFKKVTVTKIQKEILNLSRQKACQKSDILRRMIQENSSLFANVLCKNIDAELKSSVFENSLKLADIKPLHTRGRRYLKENYRLVNILLVSSKVFKKIMCAQISNFFKNFLSKCRRSFRKNYRTRSCLNMLLRGFNSILKSITRSLNSEVFIRPETFYQF